MSRYTKIIGAVAIVLTTVSGGGYYIYQTYFSTPKVAVLSNAISVVDQTNPFADTFSPEDETLPDYNFRRATSTGFSRDYFEKLNPTDKLARDFFTKYLNNEGATTKLTPEEAEKMAANYLSTVQLPTVTAKQYTVQELTTTPSTAEAVNSYKTLFSGILEKYWPTNPNEMTIMQQAFADDNFKKLETIKPLSESYKTMSLELSRLAVPTIASDLHVRVLNSINLYAEDLNMISGGEADVLSAMVGIRMFLNYQQSVLGNIDLLRNVLSTPLE